MSDRAEPVVEAVARRSGHHFSKTVVGSIRLVAGLGVEGDGHAGQTVQHRSRVRRDPTQPNLRQVHLIARELLDELADQGYDVHAGDLGENVTTRGVDLLGLPQGTRLQLGDGIVEVTGLRNPCYQIDQFKRGVLAAVVGRRDDGSIVRKAGVMAIVVTSGEVRAGDRIAIARPVGPHRALEPV